MRFAVLALGLFSWPLDAWGQPVPTVRPEVVAVVRHDPGAFTQGLLLHDGALYESTGLKGRSTVRKVDRMSGEVLESVALPTSEFGEGLALVEDRLVQLTWKNGIAHVYDLSLVETSRFSYTGEGWGLCFDGQRLVMSNGSSSLFFRDPTSFELEGSVEVTANGTPVEALNELECVGQLVYANVWQTDDIVRIDPQTGEVLTRIDASSLLTAAEDRAADVLNGIAFDEDSGHFLLTGKLWPHLFEVRFDFPAGSRDAASPNASSSSPTPSLGGAPPSAPSPQPGNSTPRPEAAPPPRPARESDSGCSLGPRPNTMISFRWGVLVVALVVSLRPRPLKKANVQS
jgi:glutaminyl-peptide cyclotransferase